MRERCAKHGLLFDPQLTSGCALCRREAERRPAFSWLRVAGTTLSAMLVFALLWKYSPLPRWTEHQLRAALGQPSPPTAADGDFEHALWERARAYWEEFQFDASDAPRAAALQIALYVPRENLLQLTERLSGERPNRSEVIDGLRQLDRALLRYPERLLRATGLERVVMIRNIVKDGAPASAIAVPATRMLLVDPTAFDGGIFDHELFHLVDYRLHGHPGDQPRWNALNPRGTAYIGEQQYAAELRSGGALDYDRSTFVSDYARVSPEEDRAETFRVLMGEPELAKQRRRASEVIEGKARYIIAALDQLASASSVALDLR